MQIPALFYKVPSDRPSVPTTVFTDHFWDYPDGFQGGSVGIVRGSEKAWFGPIPTDPPGTPEGAPDLWINGMDYDTWINGGYFNTEDCADLSTGGAFNAAYHPAFDIGAQ